MKIAILNDFLLSAETLAKWFPDIEIEVLENIEVKKFVDIDIFLVDKINEISSNGKTPYILSISPKPFIKNIDWISSSADRQIIKNKIKLIMEHVSHKQRCQELEQQLSYANELEIIGKISMEIMHELNNPLQIILGFIEDIQDRLPKQSDLKEDIDLIKEEIDRCCVILKSIKYLKNVKNEMGFQDIELVLENIIPLLQYHIRKKRIKFEQKIDPEIHFVKDENNKCHSLMLAALLTVIENSQEAHKIQIKASNIDDFVNVQIKFLPLLQQPSPHSLIAKYIKQLEGNFDCVKDEKFCKYILDFKQAT